MISGVIKVVGPAGFEPTTPCTPCKCASQAALRPDPTRGQPSPLNKASQQDKLRGRGQRATGAGHDDLRRDRLFRVLLGRVVDDLEIVRILENRIQELAMEIVTG